MLNLFRSLLQNCYYLIYKKPSDTPSVSDPRKSQCMVSFFMDQDGNIEVVLDWPVEMDEPKIWASNYAALISVINYGGFKGDIVKILLDAKQNDSNEHALSKKFIGYTLNRLSEAEKITSLNSDKPVIVPSKAFNYHNK